MDELSIKMDDLYKNFEHEAELVVKRFSNAVPEYIKDLMEFMREYIKKT